MIYVDRDLEIINAEYDTCSISIRSNPVMFDMDLF